MPDLSEAALESVLRDALAEEAAALPTDDWTVRVRDRVIARSGRAGGRPTGRLLAIGFAAMLLVPVAALLAGTVSEPAPVPGGWEAVLLRTMPHAADDNVDLSLLAVDASGAERTMLRWPWQGDWYWLNHIGEIAISPFGRYLAIHSGGKSHFATHVVDLAAADTAPVDVMPLGTVTFDPLGRAWVPQPSDAAGFGGSDRPESFTIVNVDGDTSSIDVPLPTWPPGRSGRFGPFAADGSGIVVAQVTEEDDLHPQDAFLLTEAGMTIAADDLPPLAWSGSRWLSPQGLVLAACGGPKLALTCARSGDADPSDVEIQSRLVSDQSRGVWSWPLGAGDDQPLDLSWDADGTGLWVLLRPASRGHGSVDLVHVGGPMPGDAYAAIDERVTLSEEAYGSSGLDSDLGPIILALTPDDSHVAIGLPPGDRAEGGSVAVVDTVSGNITYHVARFVGFLPAGSLSAASD